jgi:hypothetical protein
MLNAQMTRKRKRKKKHKSSLPLGLATSWMQKHKNMKNYS